MKMLIPTVVVAFAPAAVLAQDVALVKMPYTGARNVAEISTVPAYLESGGIVERLRRLGASPISMEEIRLTPAQEREYGSWHRMGLANGNLSHLVAQNLRAKRFHVGLLANCTSLLGVLGGMQQIALDPARIGLVFIDAHGDFNVPETTLSGMLGGMPVAVAGGLALHNLRTESGLELPVPIENIMLGGVRDLDPLERMLVEQHQVGQFSVADIRTVSQRIHEVMRDLSSRTDMIYVHVDMDVLDPAEVPGHPLAVPNGPSSVELARAIQAMFRYPRAVAFGVASTPVGEMDPNGVSREAAFRLIEAAVTGVRHR